MKKFLTGLFITLMSTALILPLMPGSATAALRTRIVVLPFYVAEDNRDVQDGGNLVMHYRRMSGFIENHLVRHNFEVIDPFAKEASERELNRLMERTREDSTLSCLEVCRKYGVDAVYIVWLNVKHKKTADGYHKAIALLDGKGYDSAGRSIGANVYKSFKISRRDFDQAIGDVEKEVGDLVGRTLTAWNSRAASSNNVVSSSPANAGGSTSGGGVLARNLDKLEKYIEIRLDGATEYELIEVFGKVIFTVNGVVQGKQISQRIVPDTPQACTSHWEVEIRNTDPFRVQANTMRMINEILDAGGEVVINGVPYRYSSSEVKLLMGIRPGDVTSRSVQFVIDRERARDREFAGRHDPDNATRQTSSPGFE